MSIKICESCFDKLCQISNKDYELFGNANFGNCIFCNCKLNFNGKLISGYYMEPICLCDGKN